MLDRSIALVAAISVLPVANVSAQDNQFALNFGQLVDACNRADQNWISFCDGYVQALVDSYYSYKDLELVDICLPPNATRAHLAGIVGETGKALLEVDPSHSEKNAAFVATAILSRAFPCAD